MNEGEPDDRGLLDACIQRGHSEFSLAIAVRDVADLTEHERALVDVAVTAGVVGALAVLNEEPEDPETG